MRKWWTKLVRLYYEWRNGRTPRLGRCGNCDEYGVVYYVEPMTMYPDRDDGTDPNVIGHLCRSCKADYQDHWQCMWDEYNAGRG